MPGRKQDQTYEFLFLLLLVSSVSSFVSSHLFRLSLSRLSFICIPAGRALYLGIVQTRPFVNCLYLVSQLFLQPLSLLNMAAPSPSLLPISHPTFPTSAYFPNVTSYRQAVHDVFEY
ncbi:hypothetical protein BDM02DRAFT_3122114, partial [Thelephora ganbajun]